MVLFNKFEFSNLLNIMFMFLSTCSTIFAKLAVSRNNHAWRDLSMHHFEEWGKRDRHQDHRIIYEKGLSFVLFNKINHVLSEYIRSILNCLSKALYFHLVLLVERRIFPFIILS